MKNFFPPWRLDSITNEENSEDQLMFADFTAKLTVVLTQLLGGRRLRHPRNKCKAYMEKGWCEKRDCKDRHPKTCRYWAKCKSGCIMEHAIINQIVYFYLNCDSWVRDKSKVLDANCTMFDRAEALDMISKKKIKQRMENS